MREETNPEVVVCVKDKIVREVSETGSVESTAVVVAPSDELVKGGQGRSGNAVIDCAVFGWICLCGIIAALMLAAL